MEKLVLSWVLTDDTHENQGVLRHCHQCGHQTMFRDSGRRRHNANGKNVYEFAIYKCSKGHTWNYSLSIQKAPSSIEKYAAAPHQGVNRVDRIWIASLRTANITELQIQLEEVAGKWRLDKMLGMQIQDMSRTQIERLIKNGAVLLDGQIVKPGALLKSHQIISISVE